MDAQRVVAPNQTSFTVSLNSSLNSDKSMKYGGLVHRSFTKQLKDKLIELLNYIYSFTPNFLILHNIVMVFRILQLIGPALCPSSKLWSADHTLDITVSIISIFFHILPPEIRDTGMFMYLIVYMAIMLITIIIMLGSAYYFKKMAKLPNFLSYYLVIFLATMNFLLHPIAIDYIFELIAKMIFSHEYNYSYAVTSIVCAVSAILMIFHVGFYFDIGCQSLIFRTTSLGSVLMRPHILFYSETLMVNAFIGFAGRSTKYVQVIFLFIAAIVYIGVALTPLFYGGFTYKITNSIVSAAGLNGFIFCLIIGICVLINYQLNFAILIIMLLLFVVLFMLTNLLYTIILNKELVLLDEQDINRIRTVNKLTNLAVHGMLVAHPFCVSWELFKQAADIWTTNSTVWFVFAKFVAIYPEDAQTFAWIFYTVQNNKIHGITARTLKNHTLAIMRQREPALSPTLKTKLNQIQKTIKSCKHKLRYVWDLAIQGNIGEMESGIKNAYKEIDAGEAEFKHLFRQFNNNRFVTRNYARFEKEITANFDAYADYMEKSKLLQRGISINKDQTHELGLIAFPNLPSKIQVSLDSNANFQTDLSLSMTAEDEDELTSDNTNQSMFKEAISGLSIPAIRNTRLIRIIMLFVIFLILLVVLFVYSTIFITELTDPLRYLQDISETRVKSVLTTVFLNHYIYEKLGIYDKIIEQEHKPDHLGGKFEIRSILEATIADATRSIQDAQDFSSLVSTNDNIKAAQSNMFNDITPYTFYVNTEDSQTLLQTIQSCIIQIITEATDALRFKGNLSSSIINTSVVLNPTANIDTIVSKTTESLTFMNSFIEDNYISTKLLWTILQIALIVVVVILFMVALLYQIITIQHNKEEAYRCLTLIPKNIVSQIVENLRVLKNDDQNDSSSCNDTDMNKQEDNILKVLMTGGTISSAIADRILLIIGTFVTVILEVISLVLFSQLMISQSYNVLISVPHLNYLYAFFGQSLLANYVLQILSTKYSNNPLSIPMYNLSYLEANFIKKLEMARFMYHYSRFGGESITEAPYTGFQDGLNHAFTLIQCHDPEEIPYSFMDMISCYNVEGLYIICEGLMTKLYNKQKGQNTFVLKPNNENFDYIFTMLLSPIYEGLVAPMFEEILPTITKTLQENKDENFVIIAVLVVLGFLFEILVFIQLANIERHIKQSLMLLLHCPGPVVLAIPKINQVLGGDFRRAKGDNTKRNSEFYDSLFKNLPGAVLIFNTTTKEIETVNTSCLRTLGFSEESDLVGKKIDEVLHSEKFSGDIDLVLTKLSSDTVYHINVTTEEGSFVYLEINVMGINGKHVIYIRDITNVVRYNKLIRDEKGKSDSLLNSILPPTLVKRVQAGEKNISFAVQTATIVFMDIVSFTPWCGSLPADKVMSTLNLLFKKFDSELSKYLTMTKIKCIGDCYMAAGGIFSEVNQPAEHAKEVVSFGLDAIESVRQLDEELEEKLQIRVGVNSGGPIVAGVLGIGKPTFEILGPCINMAQQMEHHGIPMKVHISRPVYELIYGDTFKIKERGTIEVKNGKAVTYLVECKK